MFFHDPRLREKQETIAGGTQKEINGIPTMKTILSVCI